jgi:hypothetical protein
VDVEWRIGSAHAFGAKGPGFDPTPELSMAFYRKLSCPFFQTTDLKQLIYVMSCCKQPKINFFSPFDSRGLNLDYQFVKIKKKRNCFTS